MSLTYGFYNSLVVNGQHDRTYDATDFAKIFSGIIHDGMFSQEDWGGEQNGMFRIKVGGGLSIAVASGRAWFNDTWTHNDSDYPLTLSAGEPLESRIDVVVLTIDKGNRVNSIGIVQGTTENGGKGVNPRVPSIESGYSTIKNYMLGYVTLPPGTTQITESMVKQTPLPYVTAPLRNADLVTSGLYSNWDAQFNEWFEYVKALLNDQDAARLDARITDIHENGVEKLKTARAINGIKFDGTTDIKNYGECTTAAATAAKTVSISNFVLQPGAYALVNIANTNTATLTNLTLNVNSTGAKPIKYRGNSLPVQLNAGLYLFCYDGTNYELISAGMENRLEEYVPITRKINNKTLTSDITLTGSDIKYASNVTTTIATALTTGATSTAMGMMSAADKKKLDGIAAGANNYTYTLPTASASTLGGIKVGANLTMSNGVLSGTPNTTYGLATASSSGLMAYYDKSKLDGIAAGARTGTLVTSHFQLDTVTLSYKITTTSKGNGSQVVTSSASKSGYYPMGIVGIDIPNNAIVPQKFYLTSRATGSCVVNLGLTIKNMGASTTYEGNDVKVYILWVYMWN